MKVLIADDDPVARTMVRRLVAQAGYEIAVAEDGAQALELVGREQPEIVLTDWMMPGADGIELCEKIRSAAPGQPYIYVILLTVRDEKRDISEGLSAGADDYIVKPFDPVELVARLRAGERIVRLEVSLRLRKDELEDSLKTIRKLKELLPICMFCKKIRNDNNYWEQIEAYIHDHTGTDFSHGVCPECLDEHYPKYAEQIKEERGREQAGAPEEKSKKEGEPSPQ